MKSAQEKTNAALRRVESERGVDLAGMVDRGPFRRVLADPPWRYGSTRALVGTGGKGTIPGAARIKQVDAAEEYPTMSLAAICALPVEDVVADDAMLFLWTTNAFLASGSAAEVVRAWGFTPKTVITWAKTKKAGHEPSMKTGHWFRGATEHAIVATRGKPRRPEGFPALPTWFPHGRLPHSVKPDRIYDLVEATGEGPYLEMFARRRRAGWSSFGNDPALADDGEGS